MLKKLWQREFTPAILAGVALFLAFPRFHVVATILLFGGLFEESLSRARSVKRAALSGFLTSVIILIGGFYWVTYVIHEFGYLPWSLSVLGFIAFWSIGALNFPVYALLASWLRQSKRIDWDGPWAAAFLAPALFTTVEYLVPKLFPWQMGHSLYQLPVLTQIVEWTGTTFLTFLLYQTSSVGRFLLRRCGQKSERLSLVGSIAAMWIVTLGVGIACLSRPVPERKLKVALVQANIGSMEKVSARSGFAAKVRFTLDSYFELTERAMAEKPDLILWPETALPFSLDNEMRPHVREVKERVAKWGVPVITGSYSMSALQPDREHNSAFLLEPLGPGQMQIDRYHKNILLAFGEYRPFGKLLGHLYDKYFPQVADFEPGVNQNPFTLKDGTRLGVTVCYEDIVPNFVRRVAKQEIQGLVNLTNDSWFGPTAEPYLHGAIAIFRSIEHRVPLFRVTNTGISFFVDLYGRQSETTPVYGPGYLVRELAIPTHPRVTFYGRYGDWFVALLLLGQAALLVLAWRRRAPFSA